MKATAMTRGGGTAGFRSLHPLCPVVVLGMLSVPIQAADDAYLQMLDKEVIKVESIPSDTAGDSVAGPGAADRSQATRAGRSREQFEAQLRQQHVGTYSFYRRLPERSREEVFRDFSAGASMEELRDKIVDRYLHP